MSHTESDFFCWGGGLKKVAACGFFAVLLWLLVLLVGRYVANAAAFAVLAAAAAGLLWSPLRCTAPLLWDSMLQH